MTDPETVTRLGAKDSDLSRATQALHDAAVVYAVAEADSTILGPDRRFEARHRLHRAAEDYAEAYLRG